MRAEAPVWRALSSYYAYRLTQIRHGFKVRCKLGLRQADDHPLVSYSVGGGFAILRVVGDGSLCEIDTQPTDAVVLEVKDTTGLLADSRNVKVGK